MKEQLYLSPLVVASEKKKKGCNNADLAEAIYYKNEKSISRFIRKKSPDPIDRDRAEALAAFFGVRLDYLCGIDKFRTNDDFSEIMKDTYIEALISVVELLQIPCDFGVEWSGRVGDFLSEKDTLMCFASDKYSAMFNDEFYKELQNHKNKPFPCSIRLKNTPHELHSGSLDMYMYFYDGDSFKKMPLHDDRLASFVGLVKDFTSLAFKSLVILNSK